MIMPNYSDSPSENNSLYLDASPQEQELFEVTCIGDRKYFNCLHPDCGKTFKFYSEIRRHIIIHRHQRPFICTFPNCFKAFKRADALNDHTRIHYKITPFECPVDNCGYKSATKSALRYHLLRHNGEKIFTCSYDGCHKTFLTCSQLRQHEKTTFYHQKETPLFPDKDDDDLLANGQIYYLEKITLNSNQNSSQEVTEAHTFKSEVSEQFFSDDIFNDFPQTTFEEVPSMSTPKKQENYPIKEKNPPIKLESELNHAVQENIDLKHTLKDAMDLLQIYKQKEKIGVDMFLRPSYEIDEEQKEEELLWNSLSKRLKHSNFKI